MPTLQTIIIKLDLCARYSLPTTVQAIYSLGAVRTVRECTTFLRDSWVQRLFLFGPFCGLPSSSRRKNRATVRVNAMMSTARPT